MLGRLAKWMRILGCDVGYFPNMEDGALVERALEEGRIIIASDTLLVKRRKARGNSLLPRLRKDLLDRHPPGGDDATVEEDEYLISGQELQTYFLSFGYSYI